MGSHGSMEHSCYFAGREETVATEQWREQTAGEKQITVLLIFCTLCTRGEAVGPVPSKTHTTYCS